MYLPPANFQQFTINDYDSVTVLVMTFFTVGFQPEGPLKYELVKANWSLTMTTQNTIPKKFSIFDRIWKNGG